jgi:hypothetical protein
MNELVGLLKTGVADIVAWYWFVGDVDQLSATAALTKASTQPALLERY